MAIDDDMSWDTMQCTDHPFRTGSSPSAGICAFCLQDKLGKLVSSSSSSTSFRSHHLLPSTNTTVVVHQPPPSLNPLFHHTNNIHQRKSRLPFILTTKNKNKSSTSPSSTTSSTYTQTPSSILLKRSKSSSNNINPHFTPRQKGKFWSFLHLPSTTTTSSSKKTTPITNPTNESQTPSTSLVVVDDVDDSPNSNTSNNNNNNNTTSFGRQVSRSRSVGCGSRSFSGDFFERISTGFGDCTLRRVESQREGGGATKHRHSTSRAAGDTIREKVRCGGLFGGFIITSSSSSSYWTADGKPNGPSNTPGNNGPLIHSRTRSWGWAFTRPNNNNNSTTTIIKDGKRELGSGTNGNNGKNSNGTPNLAGIPSLLDVRG